MNLRKPMMKATFVPAIEVEISPLSVVVDGLQVRGWRRNVILAAAIPAFVVGLLMAMLALAVSMPALLLAKWLAGTTRTGCQPEDSA